MRCARAAIEAMREPTEGMWEAGGDVRDRYDYNSRDIYRAMIDAALSEGG